jgi:hypothetical protein
MIELEHSTLSGVGRKKQEIRLGECDLAGGAEEWSAG